MCKSAVYLLISYIFLNSCSSISEHYSGSIFTEEQGFAGLMKEDALDRKTRAVAAVNQFLNEQVNDVSAAILIENTSDCNIIVQITGSKNYKVPIPRFGKNYLVLPTGNYNFTLNLCDSKYQSYKNIQESISIVLSNN